MATTKTKENTTSKEKRTTPPSSSHGTATIKRSPSKPSLKSANTTSTNDKQSSSTPSEKSVPNYLRPTISSHHESFKQAKKHVHDDSTHQKATLNRRRSFDKPPSPSRIKKSIISPEPVRERSRSTVPSSSRTTSSSHKPGLDRRASKTLSKGVKSQALGLKKKSITSSGSNKESTNNVSDNLTEEVPKSVNVINTETKSDVESKQEDDHDDKSSDQVVDDHDHLEVVDQVESEVIMETPPENPTTEDNENVGNDVHVVNEANDISGDHHDEKVDEASQNISTVSTEIKSPNTTTPVTSDPQNEEFEAQDHKLKHEEESKADHKEVDMDDKTTEINVSDAKCLDVGVGSGDEVKDDEVNGDKNEEDSTPAESLNNDKFDEEKVLSDETKEGTADKECQEVMAKEAGHDEQGNDSQVEESKVTKPDTTDEKTPPAKQQQGGQRKKETTQAYNDVIEETTSKLMEKRKNKVKALVGAFETVIDYESASK